MSTCLTGRERVNRAMEHKDHDRTPRHESFWGETITRWQGEGLVGGADAVLDLLEGDISGLCWSWPAPFPGTSRVVSEDDETQIVRDAFGATARFWKGRSGTPEHVGFECDSVEAWEKTFKPAALSTKIQVDVHGAVQAYNAGREQGRWTCLVGVESFELTRKLLGDEVSLIAMASEPEWIMDISRTHTDLVIRDFEAIMATGIKPDGVWIYGDMAYNHATMCSPKMYRELIWPDHKRLVDWTHAHGMKFIYHTDGDINGVLDLYIEAGFDAIQPLEAKANMDIRKIGPTHGDKISLFGNINVMVMGTNDIDKIEEEIRTKFAAGMATKGYIYHSDHSVPPMVSWATYQKVMELVKRYGRY
ncbi:MAG: uroporphyrinogen decarboxylase family protein [Capsulimonadaceae bacterium]|nr:uroporphyrinogen decarboxylase family protein [Capsulimonadaceae bacterium]